MCTQFPQLPPHRHGSHPTQVPTPGWGCQATPDTDAILTHMASDSWYRAPQVLPPLRAWLSRDGLLTTPGRVFRNEAAFLPQHAPHHTLVSACRTGPPPHSTQRLGLPALSHCGSRPPAPGHSPCVISSSHLPSLGLSCSGRTK